MKAFTLLVATLTLASCNTMIGLGRDSKEGYVWTKAKIQEKRLQQQQRQQQQADYGDPYGAPIY